MFKKYLMVFFLVHIIGDFYVQTNNMAKKKDRSLNWVFIHCSLYLLTMMVSLLPFTSLKILKFGFVIAIGYAIVDVVKYKYINGRRRRRTLTVIEERNIFFVDQFVHCVNLIVVSYICVVCVGDLSINIKISEILNIIGISGSYLLTWILLISIIHKPANIVISKLLKPYRPIEKDQDGRDNNAGRFIGTLERVIILIFISINQYSAIGLVLTAKSIARYDRISKEKDFAEYYLLGTLISTLIVIACAGIFLR